MDVGVMLLEFEALELLGCTILGLRGSGVCGQVAHHGFRVYLGCKLLHRRVARP